MVIKVEVFKTDSCPHCPAAVSAAESAKAKLGDQIDVEIVNANDPANIDRAREYQIMAVPTVVIDGNVEFIGAPSDSDLIEKLESLEKSLDNISASFVLNIALISPILSFGLWSSPSEGVGVGVGEGEGLSGDVFSSLFPTARTTITITRIRITRAIPPMIKYCFCFCVGKWVFSKPRESAFMASPPIKISPVSVIYICL